MKYLTLDYLYTHAFERAIKESTQDFEQSIENLEEETIDLVKTYLSRYYDISAIFGEKPIKNGVLTKIITKIIIYEAIRRNVYRKVNNDGYQEDYNWAMETLEKLNNGKMILADLPEKIPHSKRKNNDSLQSGNLSNKNFYI